MIAAPSRRFTHAEYHRMAEAGILQPDERVELIDGEIIPMFPIGPFHGGTVAWLTHTLVELSRNRWTVFTQNSIRLGEHNEPQPDIALLRPRKDFYRAELPTAADAFLLIEVSDSSLVLDREAKVPLYAKSGVPEVWIVNVSQCLVEVYRGLEEGQYSEKLEVRAGRRLAPAAFPDALIDVGTLFE